MRKNYLITLLVVLLSATITNAQVKISQVYGGGGNAGATIKQDFIQLKNTATSGAAIDISGWSVQYASATGSTWTTANKTDIPASTTLAPGQYYLIRQAAGTGGTSDITNHDLLGVIGMSGTSGKVALANSNALLTGANPTNSNLVDIISYGSNATTPVTPTEGTATVSLSSTTSAQRNNNGCSDTNNNFVDFSIVTPTLPLKNTSITEICSTTPVITITAPANATIFSPEATSVNISVSTDNFTVASGGTGNGFIKYSVNGGTLVDKFDVTTFAITPITGANTVLVKLVDNLGNDLAPVREATVTFTKATYTVVTNLAALRADVTANGANMYYSLSSAPVATYTRTTRNQKYVQDASAAILIDDNAAILNGLAIVETNAISGLKGQATLFNGVLQLVPTTATGVTAGAGTAVSPATLTIADIAANPAGYRESELVFLGNINFTTNIGTPFLLNTDYNINAGGAETVIFRTVLAEANYITPTPSNIPTTANMTALITRNGAIKQVVARNLADFSSLATSKFLQIEGLKMYPNPAKNILNIETALNNKVSVIIFDIVGKQFLNSNVNNNTVNIENLNSGIYMVKITENGKTVTQKLIID